MSSAAGNHLRPSFAGESFADYIMLADWKLCALDLHKKKPTYRHWNTLAKAIPLDAADGLDGAGLLHAFSNTACLDIDDLEKARAWFADSDVDLDALLNAEDAVCIESGRSGRTKRLYRVSKPLLTKQPEGSGVEFRCAYSTGNSAHDALPPSVHPLTRRPYVWKYNSTQAHWSRLPAIPPALYNVWRAAGGERVQCATSPTGPTGIGTEMLPAHARAQLKEGFVTTFANRQKWTLRNGQPRQVQ